MISYILFYIRGWILRELTKYFGRLLLDKINALTMPTQVAMIPPRP